ncbi:hypothetical protein BPLS_P6421 [Bathymodiolus platifrons methanotrophic gill symbiont]|uniref:hypothetical protein n=1 Tax=Bathymodiolus platifrons methanotrophic gill symbiont TaxID=113268 RepID=UPI001B79662E|nr:hypothetical protein [Bathymodiolus platifrons methanotrophic gill symbiont]GFO77778.1 hypothetical protein BPLS_P6421 [Bathymodiolus platifrons methanotrophic gill symbiont]
MLDILGISPQNKMLIRLYAPAIICMASSLIIQTIGQIFYERMTASRNLFVLAENIKTGSSWISLIILVLGVLLFIVFTFRLWKWDKGEELEVCHVCSGMLS